MKQALESTSIIAWNWQLVPFLCFKKSVRKSDEIDIHHSWIFCKFRVNIEKHWHVYFFLRVKPLFFKAEALQITERYLVNNIPTLLLKHCNIRFLPLSTIIG